MVALIAAVSGLISASWWPTPSLGSMTSSRRNVRTGRTSATRRPNGRVAATRLAGPAQLGLLAGEELLADATVDPVAPVYVVEASAADEVVVPLVAQQVVVTASSVDGVSATTTF
jgi:hypothetical protein